jgi:hypothetical protein
MMVRVSIGFYGGGMTARLSDLGLMYDGKIYTRFLLLGLAIYRSKLTESTIGSSLSALLEHALGDLNTKD